MSGSLRNLSLPSVTLPDEVVVDTNLLATRFLAGFLPPANSQHVHRTTWLFRQLQTGAAVGYVTETTVAELMHLLVRVKFESDIPRHITDLQSRIGPRKKYRWEQLYKIRPNLLRGYSSDLTLVMYQVVNLGLFVLQPSDLEDLSGQVWEHKLLRLIKRYRLTVNDATILLDAQRAGIRSVVTLDKDLHRARTDFDVYSWL